MSARKLAGLSPDSTLQSATRFGLYGVLLWAPLPLASNRPWAMAVLAMAVWVLCCIGVLSRLRADLPSARLKGAGWMLLLLTGLAAIMVAQLAGEQLGAGFVGTLSAFDTRLYLLNSLAYLGSFLLVVCCVNSVADAQRLLGVLVLSGVLQAVLAVLLWASDAQYLFLWTDFQQGARATGTFASPDHLAGYMELTLAAGLGLMLTQMGQPTTRVRRIAWQQQLAVVLQFVLSAKMLWRLLLVLLVIALVMTHSRGGNGAFFLSLLLVGLVVAYKSRRLRKPALWLVLSMTVVDLLIVSQWVGLEKLSQRMVSTAVATAQVAQEGGEGFVVVRGHLNSEESLQARLTVPALALPLVWDKPLLGHGGGTFVHAFPPIKPAGFPHMWDHAHNDYVEVAADLGLLGLALLLAFAGATAWRAWGMLGDGPSRIKPGVAAAALMALCSLGLHSMVDFNLQIPANALTLCVLLALVWAVRGAPPEAATPREGDPSSRSAAASSGRSRSKAGVVPVPPWRWAVLLACLAVASWVVLDGQRLVRSFMVSGEARFLTDRWASGAAAPSSPEQLPAAVAALQRALQITPDDALLQEQLGDLHLVQAQLATATPEERRQGLELAAAQYKAALALLPTDAQTWASLATVYDAMQTQPEDMRAAWHKALELGPNEGHVQPMLLEVALANWATATPQMQAWAKDLFLRSQPAQRKAFNAVAARYGLRFDAPAP